LQALNNYHAKHRKCVWSSELDSDQIIITNLDVKQSCKRSVPKILYQCRPILEKKNLIKH